jgi:CMP-N,N'-diacetyllegionaminic acid synthase
MINNKKLWAIIPARSGSKRLKNKNIYNFCGHPLLSWTIKTAKKSSFIDDVFVSTDDKNLANIANKYGANTPFIRPKYLSGDKVKTVDVINHAIKNLSIGNSDFIILLQPTSPLRNSIDINKSIEILTENRYLNNVVSVSEIDHPIEWSNTLPSNKSLKNFIKKENFDKRSQDFPKRYIINGAIYIIKVEDFISAQSFILEENSYAYVMPKSRSIDIDDINDLKLAEFLFKSQKNSF